MIFKGFFEKLQKNYLNKLLKNRPAFSDNAVVNTLGVIVNTNEIKNFEFLNSLTKKLGIEYNNVQIIGYQHSKNTNPHFLNVNRFSRKDFKLTGRVKNQALRVFLNKEFDILLSCYSEDTLQLKLLTALSQAKFKIGVLQTDERLNDLILKIDLKDHKTLESELIKYLTILNKINNDQ